MKIAISADSTCDMPDFLIKKYDFRLNAMPFSLGERLCHDRVDGTSKDVFMYVEKTGLLPTTSAYNAFEYKEHFSNILKEYDAVIHFAFSTDISSTGNNARLAASELKNVYVIDSRNLSAGISLLMLECYDKIQQGEDIEQIVEEMNELTKKVEVSFVIDTLRYLHKGGRCSGVALLGANLLKIKPRISVVDGKMIVTKKYRGKSDDVLSTFFNEITKEHPIKSKRVFVIQSSPVEMSKEFEKRLKDMGIEEVYCIDAGPSICIHCGQKTLGMAYLV